MHMHIFTSTCTCICTYAHAQIQRGNIVLLFPYTVLISCIYTWILYLHSEITPLPMSLHTLCIYIPIYLYLYTYSVCLYMPMFVSGPWSGPLGVCTLLATMYRGVKVVIAIPAVPCGPSSPLPPPIGASPGCEAVTKSRSCIAKSSIVANICFSSA
jgi:hypothetical protein